VGRFEWDGQRTIMKHSIEIFASLLSDSKWIVEQVERGTGGVCARAQLSPDKSETGQVQSHGLHSPVPR